MLGERSGEPLTLTSLATTAQVSRRTLYTHWGTIERVISDAVSQQDVDQPGLPEGLPYSERLRIFLVGVRDRLHEPVTNVAIASLIHQGAQDTKAIGPLSVITDWPMERFENFVGPITRDQFSLLIGPIFLSEFAIREPAGDSLIDSLVEIGVELLDEEPVDSAV